ncbi:MAG TPA: tripartite tricarboxylate transporter permease, partial [Candidatus Sumerlaeota bacterium]|nr:tripartite tricarboxylate transporter permease [Candidatus Sumerlaeota bacterium]
MWNFRNMTVVCLMASLLMASTGCETMSEHKIATGAVLGTAVGVLPGLGPAATISLLLPITYALGSPLTSIIMMAGIYCGAMYGGAISAILIRTPGTPAAAATVLEGYPMAKRGEAG